MRARPLVPPILVILLLTSGMPPAAAQAPPEALELPARARQVQAGWIDRAERHVDNYTAEHNLSNETERQLNRSIQGIQSAYDNHRWDRVSRQLTGVYVFTTIISLNREANGSEQPQEVYIDHLDPIFANLTVETQRVRQLISNASAEVETAVGLEYLYLASTLLVQGNEQFRRYPEFRDLVQASGNKTPPSMYRSLVSTVVAAKWNFQHARELVNTSKEADANIEGPTVDPRNLEVAWRTMEVTVDEVGVKGRAAERLDTSLESTTNRSEWILSTALGQRLVGETLRTELQNEMQSEDFDRAAFRQRVEDRADNVTPLADMDEAGFPAVGLKDAYRQTYTALGNPSGGDTSTRALAHSYSILQGEIAGAESLMAVASADPPTTQGEGVGILELGLLALVLGGFAGAGVVYLLDRRNAL